MPDTSTIPFPLFNVVGFTGHRNLPDAEGVAKVLRTELENFLKDYPAQWIAVSSVAEGADMIFARQALSLGLPWRALLPMPSEQFRDDFEEEKWREVEALLSEAMYVETTGDIATSSREHAYLDCGHETVNEADALFAVWDGESARGLGGTGEIVNYARKLGMPVLIIDPETLEVRRENFETFTVNDDEKRFLGNLKAPPQLPSGVHPCGAPEILAQFQTVADHSAMRVSPRFRTLATMTVVAHCLAALISTTDVAFSLGWIALPWTESSLVALGLFSALLLRKQMRHRSWIRCRLVAEVCRAAMASWGLPHAAQLLREIEIPEIRRLLNSLRILHQQDSSSRRCPISEYRENYIEHRIDDQLDYYEAQKNRAGPRLALLKAAFYTATTVGILLTFANAVHATFHLAPLGPMGKTVGFVFLPIVLPALAAASLSFISINDLQRRVARYREMVAQLKVARTQVEDAQTWSSLEREVNKTERLLIQEVLEWHTISRYSDGHG